MNKQQSIFIIISILVIINLTSIWLFYNQNTQDRTRGPRNMIVKVLQLDEQQITDYDKLITEHKEAFRVANLKITKLRSSYFTSNNDSVINLLVDAYIEIEKINKNHINDILAICDPSQKKSFKDLIIENDLFRKNKKTKKYEN
ncbi:hypothetical protein N8692_01310 [Flavobacteriales bacterium]|jgi:periplasmic protein CpxP/Spy|nr:hypothetical protein [Flavobacteriales bacterium]MDA7578104.1 hypothetical protein [Flavobacteriales bacterium]MDC1069401.1 hypothetical protein [Flavobacteriales bacterium]|tara:strand:- start:3742 stop:4173 length:432 start_codon:yes stop_codon:yes gene_type:complete